MLKEQHFAHKLAKITSEDDGGGGDGAAFALTSTHGGSRKHH